MNEVSKAIVDGLGDFSQQLENGVPIMKFVTTTVAPDTLRNWLRSKGWKRRDRASGPNQSVELWLPPWDGIGYRPLSMSLKSAVRRQLKDQGFLPREL